MRKVIDAPAEVIVWVAMPSQIFSFLVALCALPLKGRNITYQLTEPFIANNVSELTREYNHRPYL